MNKKKTSDQAFELHQSLERAGMAERQIESLALSKAKENEELSGYTEDRDLINQLLGQVQMARSIAKFADVVSLAKLAHIKENHLYQSLKGKKAVDTDGNEIADVGTWSGFCRAIGSSKAKIDEDLLNLRVFGEDAMNGLNRIGAGYRELRKLRKLDDEERELIINGEAVKTGDKEALVELIDEMASRHAADKAHLQKETDALREKLAGKDDYIRKKQERVTALEQELNRLESLPPNEKARELSARLPTTLEPVFAALLGPETVFNQVYNVLEDAPADLKHACAQALARITVRLDELRSNYGIPVVDVDFDDSWIQQLGE